MNIIELFGFTAGILETVSLLPQLIKAYKTRSTNDISMQWLIINLASQLLWTIYGFAVEGIALFVMSGIMVLLTLSLLVLKYRFDKKISL